MGLWYGLGDHAQIVLKGTYQWLQGNITHPPMTADEQGATRTAVIKLDQTAYGVEISLSASL